MTKSQIGKRRVAAKNEGSEYYGERREALLAAAATLFREKGFSATSLDDIAKLAGTDRSSLYYYVSSKKELFYEVVGGAIEAVTLEAEAIRDAEGSPAEKIERLLVALMASYARNYPHLYVFLQEDIAKLISNKIPNTDRLQKLGDRFDAVVRGVVQDGVHSGLFRSDIPPTIIAQALIGMANWTHRWFAPKGEMSAEDIGRSFARIALDGLVVSQS